MKGYRWRSIALLKALSDTPSSYSPLSLSELSLDAQKTTTLVQHMHTRTYNIQRTTLYVLLNPFCARFCSHLARVTMRMGTSSSGSAIATGAATASALPALAAEESGSTMRKLLTSSTQTRAGRCPSARVGSRRLRRASVARGRSSSQDATVRFPQASSRWSGSSSSAVRTVSRAASREGTSLRRPLEQPDDERADAGPTASEAVSAAGKASQAWRADASNAGPAATHRLAHDSESVLPLVLTNAIER